MSTITFDVDAVRRRYRALDRRLAFFDGPGGTQCPDEVIEAIAGYLREDNANIGAPYETSVRTVELVERARAAAGRWVNGDAAGIAFGPKIVSSGAQPRKSAAASRACAISASVLRLVAYSPPMFALSSRKYFATAWMTVSGTCVPPGPSK